MNQRVRRSLAAVAAAATAGLGILVQAAPAAQAAGTGGTTYYVDATSGSDDATGTSADAAWQSLDKVDATTFQPGDRILFAAGDSWTGQLWPKGSGTAGNDITVGSYGTGAMPQIQGAGTVADAVKLWNQQYWEITDLDISNQAPSTETAGANLGDFRGIHIGGDDGETLKHFVVDGVDVHDVTGEDDWIGGSTSGNKPGITFGTGWDGSKRTGGIVFEGQVADKANPGSATVLDDMTVQDSTITNTSFAGITTKQYTGDGDGAVATGWGTRTSATDPDFTPLTGLTIRNNYITQSGTSYGADGIYVTDVRGATVEDNVVDRTGTSGIEIYNSDSVTVQRNEVGHTTRKAGGSDQNAIDADEATSNILIQDNYSHDNGDGLLLCQFVFGSVTVRNNVITGATDNGITLASGTKGTASVYNNTVYNGANGTMVASIGSSSGAYHFSNNAFITSAASPSYASGSNIDYENNFYSGPSSSFPATDTAPVTGNPRLANPTVSGPFGTSTSGPMLTTADAFAPTSGSALIDSGVEVADNGGVDYAGNALYNGTPDIGAFEYRTAAGATAEAVVGTVTSQTTGAPVSGAAVSTTIGGTTYSDTTDADGTYTILDVPFSDTASLTAAVAGYADATKTISVADGDVSRVDFALTPTATTGQVSGTMYDSSGNPLPGARLTVSQAGEVVGDAETGADGSYAIADVPVATGLTVTASADGFTTETWTGVSVTPGATTSLGSRSLPVSPAQVIAVHTFDGLPAGALATGTDGLTVSPSGGSIAVTQDQDGNRYATLTRSSNSGSTSLSQTFATPLTGLITISEDVMRDDAESSSSSFFGLPYVRGTDGTNVVSMGMAKGSFTAYSGTTSTTVGSYDKGTWYHLATTIDTVHKTFTLAIDGTPVLTDVPFRAALAGGIATVDFYANSSNYGTANVDDIAILRGNGYDASDTSLATLTTDAGTPTVSGDGTAYRLTVPSGTTTVGVAATATSPLARSLTVAGTTVTAAEPTVSVTLSGEETAVPITVTAEDGTTVDYTLTITRAAATGSGDGTGTTGGTGGTGPGSTPAPSVHGHPKVHGKAKAGHKVRLTLPEFLDLPAGHHLKVVWYVDGKKVKTGTKLTLKLKRAWRGHTLKMKVTETWASAGETQHLKAVSKAIRIH